MSEPERESMEVDVLFVGAGPATLASAYHLMKEVERHNEQAEAQGRPPSSRPRCSSSRRVPAWATTSSPVAS